MKDCEIKIEVPEKEVALFYDQLMDLVAASYILYQENSTLIVEEGTGHG
ncbi:hypothetical protein RG47T_4222 [Mucilaginibacter polytrichastri]|uniref:Uncharacterized protein n=1 Tax=Mucilaginibacter polytrichastri TaxID=1302689 RepID=A0A1Q6A406_9SPHI|nr:hypothetical protein RG47T_4222 [Mucilaginibacter polytrichastri]